MVVLDLVEDIITCQWQAGSVSATFSPDGNYIAARTLDRYVKLFQVASEGQGHGVPDCHSGDVLRAAAADERTLVSGSENETIKIWDMMMGTCIQTLHGHTSSVHSVALLPDSSLVALGDNKLL